MYILKMKMNNEIIKGNIVNTKEKAKKIIDNLNNLAKINNSTIEYFYEKN